MKKYKIHKFKEFTEDSNRERIEVETKTTIQQLQAYRHRPNWHVQIEDQWNIFEDAVIVVQVYHAHFYKYGDLKLWSPSYEIECEGFTGLRQALEDLGY